MKKADNYTELQQPIQTRLHFSPETLELGETHIIPGESTFIQNNLKKYPKKRLKNLT